MGIFAKGMKVDEVKDPLQEKIFSFKDELQIFFFFFFFIFISFFYEKQRLEKDIWRIKKFFRKWISKVSGREMKTKLFEIHKYLQWNEKGCRSLNIKHENISLTFLFPMKGKIHPGTLIHSSSPKEFDSFCFDFV